MAQRPLCPARPLSAAQSLRASKDLESFFAASRAHRESEEAVLRASAGSAASEPGPPPSAADTLAGRLAASLRVRPPALPAMLTRACTLRTQPLTGKLP
jgi:hypothetical protein